MLSHCREMTPHAIFYKNSANISTISAFKMDDATTINTVNSYLVKAIKLIDDN